MNDLGVLFVAEVCFLCTPRPLACDGPRGWCDDADSANVLFCVYRV